MSDLSCCGAAGRRIRLEDGGRVGILGLLDGLC